MQKLFVSFGVVACLAACGCTSKVPESVVVQPVPLIEPAQLRVSDAVKPCSVDCVPRSGLELLRVKTTHQTKLKSQSRLASENGPFSPREIREIEAAPTAKISAIAKSGGVKGAGAQDICASTKHGHAEFLRTDLAYSDLGVDCQGDKPANR